MLIKAASSRGGDGDYCLSRSLVQIISSPAGARHQTRSPEGTSDGVVSRTRWASTCPHRIPASVIQRTNKMSGTPARCLVPPQDSCDQLSCRLNWQILRGSMPISVMDADRDCLSSKVVESSIIIVRRCGVQKKIISSVGHCRSASADASQSSVMPIVYAHFSKSPWDGQRSVFSHVQFTPRLMVFSNGQWTMVQYVSLT